MYKSHIDFLEIGVNAVITIDAFGKPCPIPVIEAKKALADQDGEIVHVKVDNFVAVQNLEKMANGYGYGFSYAENSRESYEVAISRDGKAPLIQQPAKKESGAAEDGGQPNGLAVVISRDTMGHGAEELGKILIKGFIYSLTELPDAPAHVVFLNSGAYLTSDGSNTIDDLRKLEQKGTTILTCGTCINFYNLKGKPAVGEITDMYGITEIMANADKVVNI